MTTEDYPSEESADQPLPRRISPEDLAEAIGHVPDPEQSNQLRLTVLRGEVEAIQAYYEKLIKDGANREAIETAKLELLHAAANE